MANLTRTCTSCNIEKTIENYYYNKNRKDYSAGCKECERARKRKYYSLIKDKKEYINNQLKNRYNKEYGISIDQYNESMNSSDKCEVCSSIENLCYDHDHITGKFRGVLCNKCNRSIGQLGDTMDSISKVYNYMKKYYG